MNRKNRYTLNLILCHLLILIGIGFSSCATNPRSRDAVLNRENQFPQISQSQSESADLLPSSNPSDCFPDYYYPAESVLNLESDPWWIEYNYFVDTWPGWEYHNRRYLTSWGAYEEVVIWDPYPSYRYTNRWFGLYPYYWDLWPGGYPYFYGTQVVYHYYDFGGDFLISTTTWDYPGWGYAGYGYPWWEYSGLGFPGWGYTMWDWWYYPYPRWHWVPSTIARRAPEPQLYLRSNSFTKPRLNDFSVSPRRDGSVKSLERGTLQRGNTAITPQLPRINAPRNPEPSLNIRNWGIRSEIRRSSFLPTLEPINRNPEILVRQKSLLDSPVLNQPPTEATENLPFTITVPSGHDHNSTDRAYSAESNRAPEPSVETSAPRNSFTQPHASPAPNSSMR